jgi:hypothetical protein
MTMIGKMKTQNKTTPQSNVISPNIFRPVFVENFISTLPQLLRFLCRGADGAHAGGGETGFWF